MKTFKTILSEVKQSVNVKKSVGAWQAGVASSQVAGIPNPDLFKNPNFAAGWLTGLKKGPKAKHPSYRAITVSELINKRKAMGY